MKLETAILLNRQTCLLSDRAWLKDSTSRNLKYVDGLEVGILIELPKLLEEITNLKLDALQEVIHNRVSNHNAAA